MSPNRVKVCASAQKQVHDREKLGRLAFNNKERREAFVVSRVCVGAGLQQSTDERNVLPSPAFQYSTECGIALAVEDVAVRAVLQDCKG